MYWDDHEIVSLILLMRKLRNSKIRLFYAQYIEGDRVMVINTTFNNISDISWLSDLLVEETGVPGENNRPVPGH